MTKLKINRQKHKVQRYIEDPNGLKLEMMLVPGGSFSMGAPESEEESIESERPQHQVTVPTFFLGRYPITQKQWRLVAELPQSSQELNPEPSYFKGDLLPVEQVTWYDAVEFCARLSKHTGVNYVLPSESQWEYACRAGTTTPFHFGETITTDLANYRGTDWELGDSTYSGSYGKGPKGEFREKTTEVGSFGVANTYGLSDMHGNVWEWCADPWHENYKGAPTDSQVWDETIENDNHYRNYLESLFQLLKDERERVLRGGSWFNAPRNCRSAYRNRSGPDFRNLSIGFRVARFPPRT